MPKSSSKDQAGFVAFVLIITILIIGIAATGFFIFKNSKTLSLPTLPTFGQKKTTGTFVKANNPVQNIQNNQNIQINTQSSEALPEMSRGYSPSISTQTNEQSSSTTTSSEVTVATPAPTQIPHNSDKSPTTFN